MKTLSAISLAAALLFGATTAQADLLYYGGDFDPNNPNANGLANEHDSVVGDSRVYDNFTVSGASWHVSQLFTNNQTDLTITTANWEIRSGVSEGNGGTLLFSGSAAPATVTPTGRIAFGYNEETVAVDVSFTLGPGTYWLSVEPIDGCCRSFESNTFGLNAVGTHTAGNDFLDSAFFGASFSNTDNFGSFDTFSAGVIGTTVAQVPEPGTLLLLGSALAGFGLFRRRRAS